MYGPVNDDWKKLNRFIGKLKPYGKMPFSDSVARAFKEQYDIDIKTNAFILLYDDVPEPDGWQIGALVFSSVMFAVLVFVFFFFPKIRRRLKNGKPPDAALTAQM